jgi:hypothetical protein
MKGAGNRGGGWSRNDPVALGPETFPRSPSMQTRTRNSLAIAALSLAALTSSPARAESNAFTYQGSLDDAGVPASGLHDFRFLLFKAAAPGGVVIAPPVCVDDVDVVDGVFTVELDFGPQYATGERHLQVSVRQDTGLSCADVSGFVVMDPRNHLTFTPKASHANSAFALDALDGSPANAVFVDNNGNVGIGTTTPTARLDVRGGAMLVENLGDQADLLWLASERSWVFRQEGAGAGAALKLQSIGGGGNKHFIVQTDGLMGVGTTSPTAKLDVRGDVKLGAGGEYYAVKSPANDRTLRGTILFNGNIDATRSSPGFTITKGSTGIYTINFTVPFTSPPTVIATGTAQCCRARVNGTLTTAAFIHVLDYDTDALTDTPFTFIAIGP